MTTRSARRFTRSLKKELIHRRPWRTRAEARTAIFEYIEGWFNPRRRHSTLGYLSPEQYEAAHADQLTRSRCRGPHETAPDGPATPRPTGSAPPGPSEPTHTINQTRNPVSTRPGAAHFVSDLVDEALDLSAIYASYEQERGFPPYDPRLMVKLLIYGYATGTPSSRKLEERTHCDVAVRFLCADQHPDYRPIARFRKRHLDALAELFVQALRLCRQAGLLGLGVSRWMAPSCARTHRGTRR